MQKTINSVVGFMIRLLAKIAGKDPIFWLVSISRSAELDQDQYNKLADLI